MRNYNIYVDNQYMYTSLCETLEQALCIAKREAMWQKGLFPERAWKGCANLAASLNKQGTSTQFLTEDERITYNVVLTDVDTIPENDLIYDYIDKHDDSGSIVSTAD